MALRHREAPRRRAVHTHEGGASSAPCASTAGASAAAAAGRVRRGRGHAPVAVQPAHLGRRRVHWPLRLAAVAPLAGRPLAIPHPAALAAAAASAASASASSASLLTLATLSEATARSGARWGRHGPWRARWRGGECAGAW